MVQKRKTYREAIHAYSADSMCATEIIGENLNPKLIHIRLKGSVANIPALKNQKIKGTNILRPDPLAKLYLMTHLFAKSVNGLIPYYEKTIPIFCLILSAYRPRNFDEDNVTTTVRDWLEPEMMRQKHRGWGVGIVDNDKTIFALGFKKIKDSTGSDVTEIYIRPYADVADRMLDLINRVQEKN